MSPGQDARGQLSVQVLGERSWDDYIRRKDAASLLVNQDLQTGQRDWVRIPASSSQVRIALLGNPPGADQEKPPWPSWMIKYLTYRAPISFRLAYSRVLPFSARLPVINQLLAAA